MFPIVSASRYYWNLNTIVHKLDGKHLSKNVFLKDEKFEIEKDCPPNSSPNYKFIPASRVTRVAGVTEDETEVRGVTEENRPLTCNECSCRYRHEQCSGEQKFDSIIHLERVVP